MLSALPLPVTLHFLPMTEPSRTAHDISAPSQMMESRMTQPSILTPFATDTCGPTTELLISAPGWIETGAIERGR